MMSWINCRKLIVCFSFVFLFFPCSVFAIGHNASHVWEAELLWGLDDAEYYPGTDSTIYYPDIAAVPDDAVVDEICLYLDFKDGYECSFDKFKKVNCGTKTFLPANFRHHEDGTQRLVIAYNFLDDEEVVYSSYAMSGAWTFEVQGDETINTARILITYHLHNPVDMPDYCSTGRCEGIENGTLQRTSLLFCSTAGILMKT